MCVVSMIGDQFNKTWPDRWPNVPASPLYPIPEITRAEFDALRKEVQELRNLLLAAKRYDEATGQPHCEKAEKVALLIKLGKAVGVDLEEALKPQEIHP